MEFNDEATVFPHKHMGHNFKLFVVALFKNNTLFLLLPRHGAMMKLTSGLDIIGRRKTGDLIIISCKNYSFPPQSPP